MTYYLRPGGYKLSHTNTAYPFYDKVKKKKLEDEYGKLSSTEIARKRAALIQRTDNIKIFKIPKIKL